jgi:hypothetical protein
VRYDDWMADEPRFPPPQAKSAQSSADNSAYRAPAEPVEPLEPPAAAAPRVVTRPEPPPDDADAAPLAKKAAPKLTRDEMRALMAVTKTNATPWRSVAKRGGIVSIPTGLIGLGLDAALDHHALAVTAVLGVVGLVWAARPLWKRDRGDDEGWT